MTLWVALNEDVRIAEVVDGGDNVVAWILEHRLEDGTWCAGTVARLARKTDKGIRGWDTSTGSLIGGDLTLSSSLHSQSVKCHTHEAFHGYIRDGRWVPA